MPLAIERISPLVTKTVKLHQILLGYPVSLQIWWWYIVVYVCLGLPVLDCEAHEGEEDECRPHWKSPVAQIPHLRLASSNPVATTLRQLKKSVFNEERNQLKCDRWR